MKYWQHQVIQVVALFGIYHIALHGGVTTVTTGIVFFICGVTLSISNYRQGYNKGRNTK